VARRRDPTRRRGGGGAARSRRDSRARRQPGALRRGGAPTRAPEPAPRDHWIGILERRGGRCRVTPYRDDGLWAIAVARSALGGAEPGDVVVVEPLAARRRRTLRVPSRGRVVQVLGRPGDAEADFRAVVWRRQLPVEFPPAVLEEAASLPEGIGSDARSGRLDLRDRDFVTIDPESARDHDDAVCVEADGGGGFRLWVAIADVSHYVREGSPIDREALHRGNSVYFPDRAIPMLPERLSSELCSLRPGVDRLAFAVELPVDRGGRIGRGAFHPALIRSRARLAYGEAALAMQGGDSALPVALGEGLRRLGDLAGALRRRRLAAGSIDLDLPSAEIVLDPEGRPVELREAPRTAAHRAVEEAMLAANRTVAVALVSAGVRSIFRNHEAPLEKDLEDLRELFGGLGLFRGAPAELGDAKRLAGLLERARGRPEERLVNQTVLRSLRQARYGDASLGHFALGFEHYLHFTSPIRRYADLVVHRALRALLAAAPGRSAAARPDPLGRIAERVSWRERLAMEAEREMVDLKQCAFMAERVGREYGGSVSGVAPHGLYVTLDGIFVDGLVHVSRLPGAFAFDERSRSLVARRGSRRFRLGDPLRVRVARVDRVKARIDFELASGRAAAQSSASS